MKRILSVILCIIMTLSFLASCSKKLDDMSLEGGLLIGDGVTYKYAPSGYEPCEIGEEYANLDGTLKEKLYKIGDSDPKMWLTTEYSGSATTVYYNSDITLPTLAEMKPSLCYVCDEDVKVAALYTLGAENHKDVAGEKKAINQLITLLSDEQLEEELWDTKNFLEIYQLKFYSEDWPEIYYNVVYGVASTGYYVYDRANNKCIEIGTLLSAYLDGSEE